jgi:hypothetical protein
MSGAASQSLPPLPDFGGDSNAPQTGNQDALAALMSGIAPIKKHTDAIIQAAKEIVKLGTIPGAEQIASQIISLATSLVPMAAQNLLNPMGGGPAQGGNPGGMDQMLPPPGGPAPMPQ